MPEITNHDWQFILAYAFALLALIALVAFVQFTIHRDNKKYLMDQNELRRDWRKELPRKTKRKTRGK